MDSKITGMVKDLADDGRRRGIYFLDAEDDRLRGRSLTVNSRQVTRAPALLIAGL